jgi:hypothetical protein
MKHPSLSAFPEYFNLKQPMASQNFRKHQNFTPFAYRDFGKETPSHTKRAAK